MALDPLSAGLTLAEMGYNIYGAVKAQNAINTLAKTPQAKFMDASKPLYENRAMYERLYKGGMSPASLNLAQNQFAMGQRGLMATPGSGQLRDQIGRLASANSGNFALSLAAQNDAIKRQGLAGMASENRAISGLQESQVRRDLSQYDQKMQQYGQAKQDRISSIFSGGLGLAKQNLATKDSEAERQLYRDIYGLGDGTQSAPTEENSYGGGMSLGEMSKLPYSMGGTGGLSRFTTPKSLYK